MVDFLNGIIACYKLFVDWLFSYKISGVQIGFILLACLVLGIIEHYLVGRLK